jgi:hypothetical protein
LVESTRRGEAADGAYTRMEPLPLPVGSPALLVVEQVDDDACGRGGSQAVRSILRGELEIRWVPGLRVYVIVI